MNYKVTQLLKIKLWPFIKPYQLSLALALLFVWTATLCSLLSPWLLGYSVDHIFNQTQAFKSVVLFTLLYFLVDVIRAIANVAQNLLLTKLGHNVLHDLRHALLKQIQFYRVEEFNQLPTGKVVTRIVNDTSSLQDLFTSGIILSLSQMVMILAIIGWLFYLDAKLAAVCLLVYPIMFYLAKSIGQKIRQAFRTSRNSLSQLNHFLSENISAMWLIQLFNKQNFYQQRYLKVSNNYTKSLEDTVEAYAFLQPTITILSSTSVSLLIWYGSAQFIGESKISLGAIVTFVAYLQALFTPVRDMTEKYNVLLSAVASLEKIFDFLETPTENIKTAETIAPLLDQPLKIEFKNVWFKYQTTPNDLWVLENLNFCLAPGKKYGLVGHTGSGKTTIAQLLMHFYEPTLGNIIVNDLNLSQFAIHDLRRRIAFIQQEPYLFSGSIADNITLWDSSLLASLNLMQANVNIDFNKMVYEKGSNLSAGEKQMIAFLRALVRQPSFIILDEATANIDTISELTIQKWTQHYFKNVTMLIIAHRLSTLKEIDEILVLAKGKVIEQGNHHHLIHQDGAYKKYYQMQFNKESLQKLCALKL